MRNFVLMCLTFVVSVSSVQADSITVNAFNNNTAASVSFNDGSGHSGTANTLLTQWNVTFSAGAGTPITFDTFSIDLFHAASISQTYLVTPRTDLATVFTNGNRIAYLFQTYGLQNLTSNPDQAAALQLALWDLSLNNHTPTSFGPDTGGTYSSGDPDVFSVSLGTDAIQIATLTNQYLQASIGATTQGEWLDASAGNPPNPGASLLLPVPEPSSVVMTVLAIGSLSTRGVWRRHRRRRHAVVERCSSRLSKAAIWPASARTNAGRASHRFL